MADEVSQLLDVVAGGTAVLVGLSWAKEGLYKMSDLVLLHHEGQH